MYELELQTLYVSLGLLNITAAVLMSRAWRVGRHPFVGYWAAHSATGAAAAFIYGLNGARQNPLATALAGATVLLSLAWLVLAIRGLRRAPAKRWWVLLAPVLFLAAAGYLAGQGQRERFIYLFGTLGLVLTATLVRDTRSVLREGRLSAAQDLMVVMVLSCAWYLFRILDAAFALGLATPTLAGVVTVMMASAIAFLGLTLAREYQAALLAEGMATAVESGRQEIQRLLPGLPALVFLREFQPDGSTTMVFRQGDFTAVTGWDARDWPTSRELEELCAPEDRGNPQQVIAQLIRDGTAALDWRLIQPDGSWRWMRSKVRLLSLRPDGSGELVGYVLDISAERAAEARAAAAGRLASLGDMATGLAHELRQPLAVISLAADMVALALEADNKALAEQSLQRINQQTLRASNLIEHLRNFSRGPQQGAAPEPVALDSVVEAVLSLAGGGLRAAGVTVEVQLGQPAPVVLGQPLLVEQVLFNLLTNALHAMQHQPPEQPRLLRLAAAAEPATGMVRLSVADTGGGIADAVLDRLFEPFVTTKSPQEGTGIGLSICHGLAKAMGGSIEGANQGAGAVFTLRLPAAPG